MNKFKTISEEVSSKLMTLRVKKKFIFENLLFVKVAPLNFPLAKADSIIKNYE
jgi:hypothetical protein